MNSPDTDGPASELILYRTEDAQTRIQVRLEGESVWLTQRQMADLFQVSVPTINEHLAGIYADGELEPERTLRKLRIVQVEGERQVRRLVDHYHLDYSRSAAPFLTAPGPSMDTSRRTRALSMRRATWCIRPRRATPKC